MAQLDTRLALLPAQYVAQQGDQINDAFNTYYKSSANARQNALLDLQNQEAENSNALFELQRANAQQQNQMGKIKLDRELGADLYKKAATLKAMTPEQRALQLEQWAPELKERAGMTDAMIAGGLDDGELDYLMNGLSQYSTGMTAQERLRDRELDIKENRLTFEQEQAQQKLEQLQAGIDALDVPEEDKKVLRTLSPDAQEKIISKQLDPKTKKTQSDVDKEKKNAEMGAAEVRDLAQELLSHPGRSAATGASSLLPTRPGSDAKDFEIKLNRLSSLLTVDNLDKMSGVLSESDVAILKAAAAGLDLGQSEEAFVSELERVINKMNEKLGSPSQAENKSPETKGSAVSWGDL